MPKTLIQRPLWNPPNSGRRLLHAELPAEIPGLRPIHFKAREELCDFGQCDLTLKIEDGWPGLEATHAALHGQGVTVGIWCGVGYRPFHGLVGGLEYDEDGGWVLVKLGSWLEIMGRAVRDRVFTDKALPQILETVFSEFAPARYELHLDQGSYRPVPQCTQFREPTYRFVRRLLEENSVNFWVRHEEADDVLVMTDSAVPYGKAPLGRPLVYRRTGLDGKDPSVAAGLALYHWKTRFRSVPHSLRAVGVNPETPDADLTLVAHRGEHEPGGFHCDCGVVAGRTRPEIESMIARRLEAGAALRCVHYASSRVPVLAAGSRFLREGHSEAYAVISIWHTALDSDHRGPASYENQFACIASSVPYRPIPTTPRPLIAGFQIGRVAGPDGQAEPAPGSDVHTNNRGEVRVVFPWAEPAADGQAPSAWIAVAEPVTGAGWGHLGVPRIGESVVVVTGWDGLDEQLVLASRFTATAHLPYDPEAHPGRYLFSWQSTPPGTAEAATIVQLDTARGQQHLFIQAPGALDCDIAGASRVHTAGRADATIGQDMRLAVGGAWHQHVAGDFFLKVDGALVLDATRVTVKTPDGVLVLGSGFFGDGSIVHLQPPGGADPGTIPGGDDTKPERPTRP